MPPSSILDFYDRGSRGSRMPTALWNSNSHVSIAKSIGFQFSLHRKHLPKFVRAFTAVNVSRQRGH